jgi:predicted RNase H-like nuclease (RuvC/YqgF family)
MKPLIVGVDPGSTSAVAAVDLKGEVELLESGKNFPPREIIRRVIKIGKPVVVASDKGKTPSKVEKISSSVGAKLFEPEKDISSEKKKELGKGANSHELDAVASAVNAQKKLHKDIRKIEKYDEELEKSRVEIAERIFNDRPVREEKEEGENSEETIEAEEDVEEDSERKRLERKVGNLEDQVHRLKSELGQRDRRIVKLEEKIDELREEDRKEVVKEREVQKREARIRDKEERIDDLEDEILKAGIRERQYRKALRKILEEDHRVVRIVDEPETVPDEAVSRDSQVVDKLEKRGAEIHHVEDVEGVELRDFMVVDELPDKTDFRSVIKEYKDDR